MKTPKYICGKCRQPFTRRWNANRHCKNKHSGSIENIISFTEYMINRRDSIPLNSFYKVNRYPTTNVKNHLSFDKSVPVYNSRSGNTLTDLIDDGIERELASYEVLDQLAPKYEEMDRLFDSLTEPDRKSMRRSVLATAILSNNPLEYIENQLIDFRKSKTRFMMFKDLTAFYGNDEAYTKELLKLKSKQNKSRNITIK
jgi:hypothetical protein